VLHLATHGYFVPLAGYQNNFYIEATLQSGIVLAHAGNPQPGQEDGILTAYEAMHLNLDSTELVVIWIRPNWWFFLLAKPGLAA